MSVVYHRSTIDYYIRRRHKRRLPVWESGASAANVIWGKGVRILFAVSQGKAAQASPSPVGKRRKRRKRNLGEGGINLLCCPTGEGGAAPPSPVGKRRKRRKRK